MAIPSPNRRHGAARGALPVALLLLVMLFALAVAVAGDAPTGGQTATIRGRALEADGRPALQVLVYAQQPAGGHADIQQPQAPRESASVDEEGRFEFTGLAPGKWKLKAGRKPNFQVVQPVPQDTVVTTVEVARGSVAAVEMRFPAPIVFIGRVTDSETMAGVADVRVSSSPYAQYRGSGVSRTPANWPRVESISDDSGAFRIEIPFTDPAQLYVDEPAGWLLKGPSYDAPGLVLLHGVTPGEERTLYIQMTRGASLSGTVRDEAGMPIPRANVSSLELSARKMASAITDGQGAFELTVPHGRKVRLQVQSELGMSETRVDVPTSGNPPEVSLVVRQFASVTGVVRDASGNPIPNVGIIATHAVDGTDYLSTRGDDQRSNTQGVYQLPQVVPGLTTIAVRLGKLMGFLQPGPITIDVKPGETVDGQDFILLAEESFEGTVVNEENEPLAGATVEWNRQPRPGEAPQDPRRTRTNQEGHFEIAGLVAGDVLASLTVGHEGFDHQTRANVSLLDGHQRFVLQRNRPLSLVVVDDQTSQPITRSEFIVSHWPWYDARALGTASTTAECEDGRVNLNVSPTESFRFMAAELDERGVYTGRRGVASYSPKKSEGPDVVVRVGRGGSITGTVVLDATGEPVAGAKVSIYVQFAGFSPAPEPPDPAFAVPTAMTDSEGRFQLAGLPPDSYPVTAIKDGLLPVETPVAHLDRDAEPVTIRMTPVCSMFGKVTSLDGMPVPGAEVCAIPLPSRRSLKTGTANERGEFRLSGMKPGLYELSARDEALDLCAFRRVQIGPGEEAEVNLTEQGTVHLGGSITLDGRPMTVGVLTLALEQDGTISYFRMDRDGQFECRAQPGGNRLTASCLSGWLGVVRGVEVPPAPAEQQMDFNIVTTSADVVLDPPEGIPFRPGRVSLEQKADDPEVGLGTHTERCEKERRRLPLILPGEYRARFTSDDGTLEGASDWTSITPGGENVIYVPVKKTNR